MDRSPVGGLREVMVRTRKQRRIVPADPLDGASLTVTPRTGCWTNCSVSNALKNAELRSGSALADPRAGEQVVGTHSIPL